MDGRAEGKRSRAKERSQTKDDYFIAKRFGWLGGSNPLGEL